MIRKLVAAIVVLGIAAAAAGWFLSAPEHLPESVVANLPAGDAGRGELIFWAGGCASCHAPAGAKGEAKLGLSGGQRLDTPFGIFVSPNISSDPRDGIGAWTPAEFADAMLKGTSPEGENFYPAFPYTSYARMTLQDVSDLFAFMQSLPPISGKAAGHELGFPFNIRRGVGLWKRLYLDSAPVIAEDQLHGNTDLSNLNRGRYLVEGPGHCGECHTPRNAIGGLEKNLWLAGAPAAAGEGNVPNITSGEGGISSWSASDIAYYLESGFTPDYDSVGGEMVSVQENMAKLPASDREAIAAYLKAVPAH